MKDDHSCSNGPVSTLPGHVTRLEGNFDVVCDKDNNLASHRIQGETDSQGAEYINLCEGCYRSYQEAQKTVDHSGVCDTCGMVCEVISPWRDPEEGSCGRIYHVCDVCRVASKDTPDGYFP